MNNNDTYRTIKNTSEGIYKEKGSKFLAYAYQVHSEEEIKEKLSELAAAHHQARHVCYAYRLRAQGDVYRYNDDGEPSGTAGKPIYGQLLSFNVTNVLVAVVRYFGGTKLGVGGLITAYKEAAKEALLQAEIIEQTEQTEIVFTFNYAKMSDVMNFVKKHQLSYKQDFAEVPKLTVLVNKSEKEDWISRLEQIDTVEIIT